MKRESKNIVTISLNEIYNFDELKNFLKEKILQEKYKFYLVAENYEEDYVKNILELFLSNKIEYELFQISNKEFSEFYKAIDSGIHIGTKKEILKSNAEWKILLKEEISENDKVEYMNLENCYLAYNLKDVKDILIFFASNDLEC